jgi:hypothetical protein
MDNGLQVSDDEIGSETALSNIEAFHVFYRQR